MDTYEKKYNEALERARANYKADKEMGFLENCDMLELIFPELAESEDERIRKRLITLIRVLDSLFFTWNNPSKEQCIAYLEKQKEQKPTEIAPNQFDGITYGMQGHSTDRSAERFEEAREKYQVEWSEEDDQLIGFIFDLLNDLAWRKDWAMSKEECLERLKSIRPQPKQEWSEEDEKMRVNILNALTPQLVYSVGKGTCTGTSTYKYDDEIKWLKSLRPSWKPCEEQIHAIIEALKYLPNNKDEWMILNTLVDVFKKLM